jgi:hypothetical protein
MRMREITMMSYFATMGVQFYCWFMGDRLTALSHPLWTIFGVSFALSWTIVMVFGTPKSTAQIAWAIMVGSGLGMLTRVLAHLLRGQ